MDTLKTLVLPATLAVLAANLTSLVGFKSPYAQLAAAIAGAVGGLAAAHAITGK